MGCWFIEVSVRDECFLRLVQETYHQGHRLDALEGRRRRHSQRKVLQRLR
jgi:hypothetical protein